MILFRWVGREKLVQQLQKLRQDFPGEVRKALLAEARIELKEAKARTPVDTGALRQSGRVELDDKGFRNYRANILFGNEDGVHYAVYVHEDMEAFHKVGQAKFLESVLMESAPYMLNRIAARIQLNRIRRA